MLAGATLVICSVLGILAGVASAVRQFGWTEQLAVLDEVYPYRLKRPQGNCYGLNFFSRLELRNPEVRFLLEEDIPSVRTGVRLRSGNWIEFYGLHPRPPEVQA